MRHTNLPPVVKRTLESRNIYLSRVLANEKKCEVSIVTNLCSFNRKSIELCCNYAKTRPLYSFWIEKRTPLVQARYLQVEKYDKNSL